MSGASRWLGAVLAGGESRRLGRDKARVSFDGLPLAERAARTLAEVTVDVVVVSARPLDTTRSRIPDLRPPCGPLGGIEAALAEAERRGLDGALVLACDLPLVTADTMRALVDVATVPGIDVAAAVAVREGSPAASTVGTATEPPEPLCAAYRIGCLARATTLLDRGERAVHALLTSVRVLHVLRPAAELLNANTEAELARAEAALVASRR